MLLGPFSFLPTGPGGKRPPFPAWLSSSFMARLYTRLLDGMAWGGTGLRWDSSETDYGVWAEGQGNECLMWDGHMVRASFGDLERTHNWPQALVWSCVLLSSSPFLKPGKMWNKFAGRWLVELEQSLQISFWLTLIKQIWKTALEPQLQELQGYRYRRDVLHSNPGKCIGNNLPLSLGKSNAEERGEAFRGPNKCL